MFGKMFRKNTDNTDNLNNSGVDIKDLLPLGSIVVMKDGTKKLMIYGVKQTDTKDNKEYDYIGVMYPEGNMGSEYSFLFNHTDIKEVFFRGFEDAERNDFINKLSEVYK